MNSSRWFPRFLIAALCFVLGGATIFAQDEEPKKTVGDPPAVSLPSNEPIPAYENSREPRTEIDPMRAIFKSMGSLAIVLGLILMLAWAGRKFLPSSLMGNRGDGTDLRLIQSLPLGPRRFVSLIEADGKRFLVGVTEQNINLLKAMDELPFDGALSEIEAPKTVQELMEADS